MALSDKAKRAAAAAAKKAAKSATGSMSKSFMGNPKQRVAKKSHKGFVGG